MDESQLQKIIDNFASTLEAFTNDLRFNNGRTHDANGYNTSSAYSQYNSLMLKALKNNIQLAEEAYKRFHDASKIPADYGYTVRKALSDITSSFKSKFLDENGKVNFYNKNGEFDPAKLTEYQKSYNQNALSLIKVLKEIDHLQKQIDTLPDEIDRAKEQLNNWNIQNQNLQDEYDNFIRAVERNSNEGDDMWSAVEQYRRYMQRLNVDGEVSAQNYLDRLKKEQREHVLQLKDTNDEYQKQFGERQRLENVITQKERDLETAQAELPDKELEKLSLNARSIIDKYNKANDEFFTEWKHSRDIVGTAKLDKGLAWQVLQKNFQFGNAGLTSNISKGFGTVLEKGLPKMLASFTGKIATKFGGPILAILTFIAGLLKRGVDAWMEYEEKTLEVTKNMGLNGNDAHGYQNMIMRTTHLNAWQFGLKNDDLLNIQAANNEATGRNMILDEEQLIDAVAAKKFMGDQNYAAMLKSFEMAGGSPDSAMKYGMMTMERAAKAGLNMQKASADFAKNMGLVNKYSFKGGVDAVSKMTVLSQQLKFNMESLTALFDKTATVEGAIDVAANMQMLGGTYATQFGNPMRLLYDSLNNVEDLTQTVIDTVVSKARFNEKTGTVEINNLDRAFIKEMAKQTGISQDELFNMASRQTFISEARRHMSTDLTEEQRGQLANMAQFTQDRGWVVSYLDRNNELVTKEIDKIHAEDMDAINKGRMYDTVEDNVENIWLLLKAKYRDAASEATSLKAKKEAIDVAADAGLAKVAGYGMSPIAGRVNSVATRHNDAFFYKDGTIHPLAPDDNVYAFKGDGKVDPGGARFYNNSTSSMKIAEHMTQSFIKGSTSSMVHAMSNSVKSMVSSSDTNVRFRETENMYSSIEASVSKAVSNTIKSGALKADVKVNGTIQLRFPDGTSVDMLKQLQKPEVIHAIGNIVAQQLARMETKGATPALGSNMLKGTSI